MIESRMSLQRQLSLLGAILLSALCLAIFLWNMDFEAVGNAFADADLIWVLPSSILVVASLVVRGFRWRILLLELKAIPFPRLVRLWAIGVLITTTLPFRLGELARSFLLASKEGLQIVAVLATVVIERILDLVAVVGLTVVTLLVFPFPDRLISIPGASRDLELQTLLRQMGLASAAFSLVLVTIALLVVSWPSATVHLATRITRAVSTRLAVVLASWVEAAIDGLSVLRRPRRAAASAVSSIVVWALLVASVRALFPAFGIDAGFLGAALLSAVIAFAVALPQAPGFLGVFHLATSVALVECLDIDPARANAYAIMLWVVQMAFPAILGWLALAFEGLSFSDARRTSARIQSVDGNETS